jgi:hypothetical protein
MEEKRHIHLIAREMIHTWWANRAKKHAKRELREWREVVYFGAVPYLEALLQLVNQEVTPNYGYDTTDSVILYALSNMAAFRGPEAKALKAELRTHLSRDYR